MGKKTSPTSSAVTFFSGSPGWTTEMKVLVTLMSETKHQESPQDSEGAAVFFDLEALLLNPHVSLTSTARKPLKPTQTLYYIKPHINSHPQDTSVNPTLRTGIFADARAGRPGDVMQSIFDQHSSTHRSTHLSSKVKPLFQSDFCLKKQTTTATVSRLRCFSSSVGRDAPSKLRERERESTAGQLEHV